MNDVIVLNSDLESIKYLCLKDKKLAKVISLIGEIPYQTYSSGKEFEFLVHEIIEQMLSVKAGEKYINDWKTSVLEKSIRKNYPA